MSYVLHYAPDNASLIIRLALAHRGLPFRAKLVDRAAREQESATYRALNPNGLIPVLETPQGVIFETGAILLWLADTHGGLGPSPEEPARGDFLKWLFFLSNTVHPAERILFYPEKYTGASKSEALRQGIQASLRESFETLNDVAAAQPCWLGAPGPSVADFYLAALLRWPALYPTGSDTSWFRLSDWPALQWLCAHLETLPCTQALQSADGLGKTPFTAPRRPIPPEGSAT